jgi:raffinose/stachyose/melibiose transport system permease protein
MPKRRRRKFPLYYWLFLLPALFFFVNVVVVPFFMGIVYSFSNWSGFSFAGSKFVGFQNYADAFQDPQFLSSFLLTFQYAVIMVVCVNVIGFFLALLVTQNIKSNTALRGVFFLPNLIGGLILGFIWQFIFSKLFVQLGEKLHMTGVLFNWLTQPSTAFWSLVIVSTWQMAGYVMIIYIAGLQSIPSDLLEAAEIDGAGPMKRLAHITLPLMMPSFTISLFITLSNAFKQYDTNLSLTNGGPYNTTQLIAMNIYQTAFNRNQYVLAQAKAMVFFLVIMVITLVQVRLTSKREVEM